jgi:hypothetical protein
MNEFARALLIPDWLARYWIRSIPSDEPVPPGCLVAWGVKKCVVSMEVVANSLARIDPNIGFLYVGSAVKLRDRNPLFLVLLSAYGANLNLPNRESYIDHEDFIEKVDSSAGRKVIEGWQLGRAICSKMIVAWERRHGRAKKYKAVQLSGESYWLSCRGKTDLPLGQMNLFD